MASYILLMNFTDQGIRPKRADVFKDMAKKCGATVAKSRAFGLADEVTQYAGRCRFLG